MNGTIQPKRMTLISRSALGLALALGVVAGSALPAGPAMAAEKKPKAQKFSFTKPFQAAAGPVEKLIADAPKRPEVAAAIAQVTAADQALAQARTRSAREQAAAGLDAALAALGATLTAEKAAVDNAFAAIGNEDDRYLAGNLALNLGGVARDNALQRRGLQAMLQSGKTPEADVAKFNFYVGRFSYSLKDYPTAISALQTAIAAGYYEGNSEVLLVESQSAAGDVAGALASLRKGVDRMTAAGAKPPENMIARGYQIAYKAKMNDAVREWSAEAAKFYPTPFNWLGAFQLATETHGQEYTTHEEVDLGRLSKRSGALNYEPKGRSREYVSFIQAAEARRLWPEVTAWSAEAIAVGALPATDPFIREKQTMATAGLAADARDLAGMTRDAPSAANGLTALGAADKLLSAGNAADAERLFKIALEKGGVDRDRVLTRLGIAQLDLGKYAEAKATFQQITGPRATLGRLGAILADTKAAAAAAPVAPAAQ